jgi:hypothetical protein
MMVALTDELVAVVLLAVSEGPALSGRRRERPGRDAAGRALAALADQVGEIEAAQSGREASGPDRAGRPEKVGSRYLLRARDTGQH